MTCSVPTMDSKRGKRREGGEIGDFLGLRLAPDRKPASSCFGFASGRCGRPRRKQSSTSRCERNEPQVYVQAAVLAELRGSSSAVERLVANEEPGFGNYALSVRIVVNQRLFHSALTTQDPISARSAQKSSTNLVQDCGDPAD